MLVDFLQQVVFIRDYLFLQILLLFLFYGGIAVVISLFLGKIAKRLAHFSDTDLDNQIIDCLHSAVSLSVIGIAFIVTLKQFDVQHGSAIYAKMILLSLILLTWIVRLKIAASITVDYYVKKNSRFGKDLLFLVHKLFLITLIFIGIFLFLQIWDVNFAPLLASAGIAGIAVAMAAKDTLANFFGGISLFLDQTYKVGDYIIVDDKDRGEVVSLGIRSTRILTRDDVLVTVPNNILANSRIINETAPYAKYRIKIPVGVAYGSDLDKVESILLGLVAEGPTILDEPKPRVRVRALADSAVNFELMVWVKDPRERGRTIHGFLKTIHTEFIKEGIEIPFPQIDLHLDKAL
jgi:small-conductance mechanosensitive channel